MGTAVFHEKKSSQHDVWYVGQASRGYNRKRRAKKKSKIWEGDKVVIRQKLVINPLYEKIKSRCDKGRCSLYHEILRGVDEGHAGLKKVTCVYRDNRNKIWANWGWELHKKRDEGRVCDSRDGTQDRRCRGWRTKSDWRLLGNKWLKITMETA